MIEVNQNSLSDFLKSKGQSPPAEITQVSNSEKVQTPLNIIEKTGDGLEGLTKILGSIEKIVNSPIFSAFMPPAQNQQPAQIEAPQGYNKANNVEVREVQDTSEEKADFLINNLIAYCEKVKENNADATISIILEEIKQEEFKSNLKRDLIKVLKN